MKQVKLRSMLVLALIAVLGAGVVLFCVRYVVRGGQWAAFSANDHAYRNGRLALGQVLDRNGVLLYDGASGSWAEDGVIRREPLCTRWGPGRQHLHLRQAATAAAAGGL
ncbi:MAG: hypothetical protein ACLSHM_01330 [Vescimonas sp.]